MEAHPVDFETDEIFDDYRNANHKLLVFKQFASDLIIQQDFKLGKGGIFWDTSFILAKFLTSFDMNGKKVLELGAATALPSIVAGLSGANVWATDIFPALKLTEACIELNRGVVGGNVRISELDWCINEQRSNVDQGTYDFILLSDVFYLPELADDFIDTLIYFCGVDTVVLICYRARIERIVVPYIERLNIHFDMVYHDDYLRSIYKGEYTFLISAKKKISP